MAGGKIGDVYYVVSLDASGLPQLAKKEGEKAGEVAGKSFGTKMKAQLTKGNLGKGLLQGLGLGAGLAGVSAVTAGVEKLTAAIGGTIQAASDQREAMSLGAQVFEDNADEMKTWAEGAADAFGQSTTEALTFAANFGNAFKNVGFALDEASDKSRVMTELAADLGSAFNAGADEAALALRSGLLGESEPLRRFGVFLDEAKVKAKAVQLGIAKLGDTLTDNQKVTARYALIMEQTADSQGMFGRDTESLADAQKSLQATLADISAEVGTELIPVLAELVSTIKNDLIPAGRDAAEVLGDLGGTGINLLDILGQLPDVMNPVAGSVLDMRDAVKEFEEASLAETAREGARGVGVLASSAADAKPPIDGVTGAAGDAGDALTDMGADAKKSGDKVVTSADRMREAVRAFRDEIITAAQGTITRAYEIINDRAELTATNVELAELRKVIATGKATQEQKARYAELGQAQVQLVVDLAKNGVTAGKSVNTAMNQIRERLKTATGQERIALQATLTMLQRLAAQAILTRQRIALVNTSRPTGGRPDSGREHGGPVTAGVPYVVGERRAELFVPEVSGTIIPQVPSGWQGQSGGGDTYNIPLTVVGAPSVVESPADLVREMRRSTRLGLAPAIRRRR